MKLRSRWMGLLAGALVLLSMGACGAAETPDSSPAAGGTGAQIPNPFVDCQTLEEAEELAGFELTVPVVPEDGSETFRAQENNMLEVIFTNGQQEIRIRKAPGSEDISGDYNQYAQEQTAMVGEREVTLRGQDDLVYAAIWNTEDFSYSVTAASGAGQEQLLALIQEIS